MNKNKHTLDNEVTNLFPLTSYVMLSFILFLVSFKNPYVDLKFRKDREYGVFSERFFKTLDNIYRKWPLPPLEKYYFPFLKKLYYRDNKDLTFNLVDRPFSYLSFPLPNFLLTKHIFGIDRETNSLKRPMYFNKLKERNMVKLDIPFKTEILLYLKRFYYNYYSKKHENKIMNYGHFTRTDRAKLNLKIGLTDEILDQIHLNILTYFGKDIQKDEISCLIQGENSGLLSGSVKEVEEFLIKSAMVRRPPHLKVNTHQYRTDGVYLLHNGVGRFRELLYSEILRFPELSTNNIMNYVRIGDRSIEIFYHGKRKRLKFNQVVDFNNKPFLLSAKFVKLIDDIYDKYELHHFVKYAQVYTRLFNRFGDKMAYFLLGVELPQYTGFDYEKFKNRYENLTNPSRFYRNFTFKGFEFLFYDKRGTTKKKPDNRKFLRLCKILYENKIYSADKRASLVDRFCYRP